MHLSHFSQIISNIWFIRFLHSYVFHLPGWESNINFEYNFEHILKVYSHHSVIHIMLFAFNCHHHHLYHMRMRMHWNSNRHKHQNDQNYFVILGHSATHKYVLIPCAASKSISNLLKTITIILPAWLTTLSSAGGTLSGRWRSWTCWRARSCCSCTRRTTTAGARCASSLNSKTIVRH